VVFLQFRIGITDNEWFEFLRRQSDLDEVNFWQPGGRRQFRALEQGEPFLFKLHAPLNFIVGGGFYFTSSILPCSTAWDTFGLKNGAPSFLEMRARIEKYRGIPPNPNENYAIGCIILREPFFLNEEDWIPIPENFSKHIQQGKNYDTDTDIGRIVWDAVMQRMPTRELLSVGDSPVEWREVLTRQRRGQGAFQILVLDAYERRCAVTREKALPVLEEAHIQPVTSGGTHRITNGILLRSDFHSLFDRGYLAVTPDYRVRTSPRLKKDFDDGEYYMGFDRLEIELPPRGKECPDRALLEWHVDTVFRG
jgi:putative restriction endonuclease